jgi:hypothetical protein
MPRYGVDRVAQKRKKIRLMPVFSEASYRIHDAFCESNKGRPNERLVAQIANNLAKDILREEVIDGKIEEVDFNASISEPYGEEDRKGIDIKITFILPHRLEGKSIFIQVKSSKKGARNFREAPGSNIPVVVVKKSKDSERDKKNRQHIALFIAGLIRQELKKENQCEASA